MLLPRRPRFYINRPIRLIELFAGIGAQAKAFERLGSPFCRYRVCEFDSWSIKAYNLIHGTSFTRSDICDWESKDLGIVDTDKYCYVMTYSFPCQDLSSIGKGRGMQENTGTRSSLIWQVGRLLKGLQELPQVLIMENVVQVHNDKNIRDFQVWVNFLRSLGYTSYYKDLNAKDFDCPQDRNRCFMISILGDYDYTFPLGVSLKKSWLDLLEPDVPTDFYLDFRFDGVEKKVGVARGLDTARHILGVVGKRAKPYVWDDFNSRMKDDQDCFGTLTTNCGNKAQRNGYKIIEPDGAVRVLTPLEAMRLMCFDDCDYLKVKDIIPKNRLYQQAGNSICINILEEIVRKMLGEYRK